MSRPKAEPIWKFQIDRIRRYNCTFPRGPDRAPALRAVRHGAGAPPLGMTWPPHTPHSVRYLSHRNVGRTACIPREQRDKMESSTRDIALAFSSALSSPRTRGRPSRGSAQNRVRHVARTQRPPQRCRRPTQTCRRTAARTNARSPQRNTNINQQTASALSVSCLRG